MALTRPECKPPALRSCKLWTRQEKIKPVNPHLLLMGMTLMWGASWPAGRIVAQAMPPLASACLRFLLASLVLWPWLYYRSGGFLHLRQWSAQRWMAMLCAATSGVFGYASFFLYGLQYLPASRAALVITLNPVVTALLAAWLFKESLNAGVTIGISMALLGTLAVLTHGHPLEIFTAGLGWGEVLILGCVACWATYTLIGRWMLGGVDALSATAVTASMGALLLGAASWWVEGSTAWHQLGTSSTSAWAALLFLAWAATALAYAWYFFGVQALGAGAASGYISLVPVVGVAISALMLGEALDSSIIFGGAMAVVGTALMQRARR